MKLVGFLQKLKGEMVTVEMKDNSVAMGIVAKVDGAMNVILSNAKCKKKNNDVPKRYSFLTIRGSTIRQILLPDALNLDALLMEKPKKLTKPARKRAPK